MALSRTFRWTAGVGTVVLTSRCRYQNQSSAQQMGLYSVDAVTGVVTLGVDHTNNITMGSGRPSLRLESIETYEHGLFLADFLHMPPSQCGLWPACE